MIENDFAQILRNLRESKGFSQEKLAELVSVSVMTIRRWEWGQRVPRLEELKKISEIFGITVNELLNEGNSQTWELKLVINKTGEKQGGILDMTGTGSTATLSVGDDSMAITLSANYSLWEDEAEFESLIENLRRKRLLGLKTRHENW